jgi:hypothetical protein
MKQMNEGIDIVCYDCRNHETYQENWLHSNFTDVMIGDEYPHSNSYKPNNLTTNNLTNNKQLNKQQITQQTTNN